MTARPQPRRSATLAALLLLTLATAGPAAAQRPAAADIPGYPGLGVFDAPNAFEAERRAEIWLAAGEIDRARAQVDALLRAYPAAGAWRALRARIAAADGDDAKAIEFLEEAAAMGFGDLFGVLARPPLNRLANDPRVAALTARMPAKPAADAQPPATATVVDGGLAPVSPENARWNPTAQRIELFFAFPTNLRRAPLFARAPPEDSPLHRLARLVRRGQAAGNAGDLYDNRDDGHSVIRRYPDAPTQLSHVTYDEAAKRARIHYGLNESTLFNTIVFGNSSTAIGSKNWRSQPRHALTKPEGPLRLWQLYANNHIYVFPEHHDHDPESGSWKGDVFPAYTPYMVVSQGSSGSDKPFLEAIQAILAALPTASKQYLKDRKLIAPTVQLLLRRTLKPVATPEDYLTAKAHPTVFLSENLDLAAAIEAANALLPDKAPPMVTIRMLEEEKLTSGADFFADGLGETLFDTPAAIARVWRGVAPTRRYLIQAEAEDPNGRPVKFLWRILRGDPDRIAIAPLKANAAAAEIGVEWHDRGPTPERPDIPSHRVDIAVFADNGAHVSAPAIFSIAFPSHQTRVYAKGPNGLRVESVDYRLGPSNYADPAIWPLRDWKDEYRYGADGEPLGWTRIGYKAFREDYLPDGRRKLKDGGAAMPRYPFKPHRHKLNKVVEERLETE